MQKLILRRLLSQILQLFSQILLLTLVLIIIEQSFEFIRDIDVSDSWKLID